jgi:hypothetical protein
MWRGFIDLFDTNSTVLLDRSLAGKVEADVNDKVFIDFQSYLKFMAFKKIKFIRKDNCIHSIIKIGKFTLPPGFILNNQMKIKI